MTKTWKELKAEGVKRCCAVFTSGKVCRRRAAINALGNPASGFCSKHGKIIGKIVSRYSVDA